MGGRRKTNQSPENYRFENTRYLVSKGLYKYTRHPMYSSLLFLTWGALFKHVSIYSLAVALATSFAIYIAAKTEEKENSLFFGEAYKSYMKKTKMFVPFIY
jgi:protein-S-isoprenylcysteine O-methyltransferase Ste14